MNISLETSQSSFKQTPSKSGGRSAKRKRVEMVEEYSQESSSSGYTTSGTAKGGMEVYEVDPDGQYIKLHNTTKKVSDDIMGIRAPLKWASSVISR